MNTEQGVQGLDSDASHSGDNGHDNPRNWCVPDKDEHGNEKAESPAEQLIRLRKCFEQRQREQKAAEANLQLVESEVGALTQLVDDFEKIVAEYSKVHRRLADNQQEFKKKETHWQACLSNILEPGADQKIRDVAQPLKKEIKDLQAAIPIAERALVGLKLDRETRAKERDASKSILEIWKKPVASIEARHAQLKGLEGEIEKAHKDHAFAYAYWLLIDDQKFSGKADGEPSVLSAAELRERLKTVWQNYRAALDAYKAADENVKVKEKTLEIMKARLDEAQKKLDATMRSELSQNVKPK